MGSRFIRAGYVSWSGFGYHSFDSDDGFSGPNFGDQELESGSIEFDTSIGIDGNNNDRGVGLSQFANTGNFANQQGSVTYGSNGHVVTIGDGQFGEQRLRSGDIKDSVVISN